MGSGKTTKALEQVSQFVILGFKTMYITSKLDKERAPEAAFYSHNPASQRVHELCITLHCESLPDDYSSSEVIVIDEAQFFSNLVPTVHKLLALGKNVQVYGLAADFKGDKFGSIIDLIPFADNVEHMKAKCMRCTLEQRVLVPAAFTDKEGVSKTVLEVGCIGKYLPVCRKHHTQLTTA
ncbi:Thymidine kinase [uncultured virus]|nr:Thymidine kinase [uncultured virus]